MKLSILMPVYNEKNTINEILNKINAVKINKEIIVVDDGSTDGTREILKNIKNIKLVCHEKNKGKGAAIRTAIGHAAGDICIIQDADMEYDPNDYYNLVEPIDKNETEIVYGYRKKDKKRMYYRNYYGNAILTSVTNILYRTNIHDEATCYKVFKTDILKNLNLKCSGFEFCPEVTAKVLKKGYKIHEVPISYSPRTFKEGKKIKFNDGITALWTLIKYRFMD